ncbi:MAG: NADP-dependent phosphogluconate dehydrogenase [Candidatus Peribacteraceae bacterium]|nr:NADP-dependent phosphogluconate dehydrogenase [Candidatus Peribacteraceae bacterium]
MQQLGVIGLGTMGANLARNAARNGAAVSVYNRTAQVTEKFLEEHGAEGRMKCCKSYKEFVQSLDHPRAILLMVKAGEAVDAVLQDLLPLLEKGDVIIDGGNSHYPDTQRRTEELAAQGIHFIGMGISGGEEGALSGPSMMPGGNAKAYKAIAPLLTKMAADDGEGGKCISYIGEGGAGHFVKMVHNGIEYGIMQLLAESYALLKNAGGFSNEQLAETFAAWNDDADLSSFLLEITAKIFTKKDEETGGDLIDLIADSAGQKGTGKWTTEAAMTYGVAIPTINAAVDARILSGSAEKRAAHRSLPADTDEQDPVPPPEKLRSIVRNAFELAALCTYGQGFDLIERASEEEGWKVDLSEVARIWRGGCIIRSAFLPLFQAQYGSGDTATATEQLMQRFAGEKQRDWRRAVTYAASRGIPAPALSASLHAYDAYRAARLPQNLIQAQRDFFGAHTFERTDKEGKFHADWQL